MTNKILRKTPETESGHMVEPALAAVPADDEMLGSGGKSRRDALAILAKHTAYTAPAVLTILSVTANRAKAFSF